MEKALLLSWDQSQITQNQIQFLMEEEGLSKEEAENRAYQDSDLFEWEWKYLTEELTELIRQRNPSGCWYAEVENFGWRSLDGYQYFTAETGLDLLRAVLPNTDCLFRIYDHKDTGFAIQNYHHDSPTGKEWYYIVPDERITCDWCGDLTHNPIRCLYCGMAICEDCYSQTEADDEYYYCDCGLPIGSATVVNVMIESLLGGCFYNCDHCRSKTCKDGGLV